LSNRKSTQSGKLGKFDQLFDELELIIGRKADDDIETSDERDDQETPRHLFPYGGERRDFLAWK